eukprot:177113_1
MPTANFPVSILQRSVKITNEPPRAYLGCNICKTKDEIVNETANKILKLCPSTTYSESIRYNKSFDIIKNSLKSLLCAEIVMTNELEIMANSLFDNIVPDKWQSVAYRSLQNHARKRVKPMDTISFDFKLERKDGEVFSFLESEPVC